MHSLANGSSLPRCFDARGRHLSDEPGSNQGPLSDTIRSLYLVVALSLAFFKVITLTERGQLQGPQYLSSLDTPGSFNPQRVNLNLSQFDFSDKFFSLFVTGASAPDKLVPLGTPRAVSKQPPVFLSRQSKKTANLLNASFGIGWFQPPYTEADK